MPSASDRSSSGLGASEALASVCVDPYDMMCSYSVIKVTSALEECIKRVMKAQGADRDLLEDLSKWLEGEGKVISFDLVRRVHCELKTCCTENTPLYLHDLVVGSSIHLPEYVPPPRNPQLVARLEAIKARAENQEYKRMVKNVDQQQALSTAVQYGLEVSSVSRQLWTTVNFLVTVVGSFVFGYFAAYFADMDTTVCVFVGLGFGLVVFLADLYFLVRVPGLTDRKKDRYS